MQLTTIEEDPLLNVGESRKIVPVSDRHLRRMAGNEIPCVRIGPRSLRFRRSDLIAFIESRTEAAGSKRARS